MNYELFCCGPECKLILRVESVDAECWPLLSPVQPGQEFQNTAEASRALGLRNGFDAVRDFCVTARCRGNTSFNMAGIKFSMRPK